MPGRASLEGELTAVLGGPLPGFLVLCGPPASGKSTLARGLVELGWVHLDKDRDGDRLSPLIMSFLGHDPHDRDSTDYRRFGHGLAMRLLAIGTADQLNAGHRVVVEGPFISASIAAAASSERLADVLAEQYGFPEGAATVWLTAPAAVRRERMAARGAVRDTSKLADWESYVAATPARPEPQVVDVVVAMTQPRSGGLRLRAL